MPRDKPANLPRPPVCPHCAKPMRFASAERDKDHANLRHVICVCDGCSHTRNQVVVDIA